MNFLTNNKLINKYCLYNEQIKNNNSKKHYLQNYKQNY